MEATVAAEHQTRQEIVTEAAEEKPARGRRRRKADADLQVEAPTAASAETEAGQEAILIEAEVEPGAQIPAELPQPDEAGKKPRSRRKTAAQKAASVETPEESAAPAEETPPAKAKGTAAKKDEGRKTMRGRSKAAQAEEAAAQPEASEKPKSRRGTRKKADAGVEASGTSTQHPVDPPATGVEIIDETERGGNYYHTMRDLRNGQTVHNVTRQSARRLWLYAVQQHRRGAPEISEVFWHPELRIGVWRRESRAGALRYDLVSQYPDGSVRIFYGVTPDGLRGPWEEIVRLAEEAGYEGPEPAQ